MIARRSLLPALTLSLCFASLAPCGRAAAAKPPPGFSPKDPLDTAEKRRVLAIHEKSDVHKKLDKNFNGTIEPEEIAAYEKSLGVGRHSFESVVASQVEELEERARLVGRPLTVEEGREMMSGKKAPAPKPLWGNILVRQSLEDVSVLNPPAKLKAASSATLGYTEDRTASKSSRQLRAALIYPFENRAGKDGTVPYGGAFGLMIDQLKTKPAASSNIDRLAASLTGELELLDGTSWLKRLYLRGAPFFETDSDLESRQVGASFQAEPLFDALGAAGNPMRIGLGEVELMTRWQLVGETGRVLEAGARPGLVDGRHFTRAGPRISATIYPNAFSDVSLTFTWQHFDGTGPGPSSTNYIDSALAWPLDQNGHTLLKLSYRKGQTPLNGTTRIDAVTFGAGVKY